MNLSFFTRPARVGAMLAAVLLLPLAACDSEELLDVTDPDIINPGDVQSPSGAEALRLGALYALNYATSGGLSGQEGFWLAGGMLADEWRSGDTFVQRNDWDSRSTQDNNTLLAIAYRTTHRARVSADIARQALEQFEAPDWQLAQMYFVQAYAENQLAESLCSGLVFSTFVEGEPVPGEQLTSQEAYEQALSHVDAGLALAGGTDAEDEDIFNALSVLKGRILLNLDRPAEAATAVATVPDDFVWENEHSATATDNTMWSLNVSAGRYIVGNGEGTNGIDFVGAADPRVPTCEGGDAECDAIDAAQAPFDPTAVSVGGTPLFVQLVWPTRDASAAVVSGVEARLIEAEAELAAGQPAAALLILNDLRTTVPGLTPLTLEATTAAQEDQLFRERAFWLFGTGHRLGDLRRLIRQYGRDSEAVFPTGNWFKSNTPYGTDVNLPVPQNEENNENFTGCFDREA
jgi:hypothetical protein